MGLLIVLIISEILTLAVLRQHFFNQSKLKYNISVIAHFILSIWLWILYAEVTTFNGFFDEPQHIWLLMNLTGMMIAVVVPRIILIILHFSGKMTSFRHSGHKRWLTNTGLTFMLLMLTIIGISTFSGRFNFKTEKIDIKIKGLNKELDGLKIIQLSDFHLAGFYHHNKFLEKIIKEVNTLEPDLILNTGDFVSYGWREFDMTDTILSKAKSRYGNFAVMGNHDFGTYHPRFSQAERNNNVLLMNQLIKSSGYKVLNDEFATIYIGKSKIALIGVITVGRHPDIVHGDIDKAMAGLDSVDFKILLSHDPNHWSASVEGKTDIGLTLSGHTHGMQMGILTKKFRWSPSKYFYPHWSGLFSSGSQYHYVNRGLGVLAIPFRIWMPPEITLITLTAE